MKHKAWLLFATVASLVLAGCATSTPSATNQPTSTTVPTATATVDALKTPLPSQGWVNVPALKFAKNVAFSTSDPFTGYACGNIGVEVARTAADVLELSVTHDGGKTWSAPAATTVLGAGCDFSINPADAGDLVMMAWRCYGDCNPVPSPYRSHDGGKTWVALQLSQVPGQAAATIGWIVSTPAWIGNTAYFAEVAPGAHGPIPRPPHAVISNTSGAAFSATNDAGIYALFPDAESLPGGIWAHGSTLVVTFEGVPGVYVKSTDNGATWQRFTPTIQGGSGGVLHTTDGGMTYQRLPALSAISGGYSYQTTFFDTKDGTVIVAGPLNIWLLAPGASSWRNAAKLVTDSYGIPAQTLALSTDALGHPVLAWSQASRTVVNGIFQPGIAYHGLG